MIFSDFLHTINEAAQSARQGILISIPWMFSLVLSLFTVVNSIRILAYLPQIMRAARDKNGASAISYTTWGLFFVSHLTTIAYAIVVQGDGVMALVFLGNALACLAIVAVTFFKRRVPSRQLAAPETHVPKKAFWKESAFQTAFIRLIRPRSGPPGALAFTFVLLTATAVIADPVGDCANAVEPAVAIEGCSRVIKADRTTDAQLPLAFNNRCNAHGSLGRSEEAIDDYSRAIALEPHFVDARYNRAVTASPKARETDGGGGKAIGAR